MRIPVMNAPQYACPMTLAKDPEAGWGCKGADCMAWRWAEPLVPRRSIIYEIDATTIKEPPRPSQVPASWKWVRYDEGDEGDPARWLEPAAEAGARRAGFCGLALKPKW